MDNHPCFRLPKLQVGFELGGILLLVIVGKRSIPVRLSRIRYRLAIGIPCLNIPTAWPALLFMPEHVHTTDTSTLCHMAPSLYPCVLAYRPCRPLGTRHRAYGARWQGFPDSLRLAGNEQGFREIEVFLPRLKARVEPFARQRWRVQ